MTAWWARWSLWIAGSTLLTSLVIGNAFYLKKQFYPTAVYITKSKPSMAVIYAQALLFVIMMGKLFRKLFFGQLRAAEFEHLVERSWYAVTETCLAFTVFRDDFSPKFLALFTLLLFLKSFHWLAEERVDYMERSPVITLLFHVRVLSLLAVLMLLDAYFVNVAYQSTMTKGASVQLVFGFEYAILTTIVLNTLAKYVFHLVDMQNETPWENKAVFVLHTEVIIGLFKVVLYILFVIIMVRIYTLPLFALRPTYLALRSFKKALNDVLMSRRAINNMNNLYPDVTAEELAATDNVCIICREEMTGGAKKLPCNHIFHVSCLRSWFQRQQTCPTCRLNVLRVPVPPAAAQPQQRNNIPPFNQFQVYGQFRVPGGVPQGQGPYDIPVWAGLAPQWAQQMNQNQANAQAGAQPQQQGTPNETAGSSSTATGQGSTRPAGTAEGAPASATGSSPTGPDSTAAGGAGPIPNGFSFGAFPTFTFAGMRPGSSSADGSTQSQPIIIPPMPYIPLIPPPPPLLNVTGLSDEELRRMEGETRAHIEARLQCLRNVQILLDSAVVQMQQYATVVTANSRGSETGTGGASSASAGSAPGTSTRN
ncbi:unnamed protein product [Allacma fusca]|uniref:RING-type E3 ubiquitin transferase n=1 Tax=Allacma fusca TaxID=39272 RepID=A0A8J2NPU5_9HEXA|nr:unnamed protein product [Allacma fusca]